MICNFVLMNLFVAIFLENFELNDEAKSLKQMQQAMQDMQEDVLQADANGQFDPTRVAQLRILQLSMFLDSALNKHVFQRLSKFTSFTLNAVSRAPRKSKQWTASVLKFPKKINRARRKLRMKLNRDGSMKAALLMDRKTAVLEAKTIVTEAVAVYESKAAALDDAAADSHHEGWLVEMLWDKKEKSKKELKKEAQAAAAGEPPAQPVDYNPAWVRVGAGSLRIRRAASVVRRIFRLLDRDDVGAVVREDFVARLSLPTQDQDRAI